jgi:hypothetical protein
VREYVFISYAKEDGKEAAILNQFLKSSGVNTWIDFEQLLPGMDWRVSIKEAIKTARAIIFLASAHSINKQGYVQSELKHVIERAAEFPQGDIFVIVARIDTTVPRDDLLRDRQWVELFADAQQGYRQILLALKHNSQQFSRYRELAEKKQDRDALRKSLAEGATTAKQAEQEAKRTEQQTEHPYEPAPNTTARLFHPDQMDIYCNKRTREVFVFHGIEVNYADIERLEYHYTEHWVAVILHGGQRLDLGVRIQWLIRPHWERTAEVMIVRTREGESVDGTTVRMTKVGPVPPHLLPPKQLSWWMSLLRFIWLQKIIARLR